MSDFPIDEGALRLLANSTIEGFNISFKEGFAFEPGKKQISTHLHDSFISKVASELPFKAGEIDADPDLLEESTSTTIEIKVSSNPKQVIGNKVSERTGCYIILHWDFVDPTKTKIKLIGIRYGILEKSDWKPGGAKMNSTSLSKEGFEKLNFIEM